MCWDLLVAIYDQPDSLTFDRSAYYNVHIIVIESPFCRILRKRWQRSVLAVQWNSRGPSLVRHWLRSWPRGTRSPRSARPRGNRPSGKVSHNCCGSVKSQVLLLLQTCFQLVCFKEAIIWTKMFSLSLNLIFLCWVISLAKVSQQQNVAWL